MFKKLDKLYGLDCNKERNDLTIEQERKYIEDCFDTYEKIGFLDFFIVRMILIICIMGKNSK